MVGDVYLHFFPRKAALEHDLDGVDVHGAMKLEPDPLWRALCDW